MIKKIILTLFIFILQIANAQEQCGTVSPTGSSRESANYVPVPAGTSFCVNVAFHIVRDSDGSNGFDATKIPDLVALLNQYYNPHSISIINTGLDYIDNSTLSDIDDSANEFYKLLGINTKQNAINFYIVKNSSKYAGLAVGNSSCYVRKTYAIHSTSAHELGHILGLDHTHDGTVGPYGECAELRDGSNCASCGDYVCDTPADSRERIKNGYNPDLTNIMSYYDPRDHFTAGQGARMRYYLYNNNTLQKAIALQCSKIEGVNTLCSTATTVYTFFNPANKPVVWSVSSNLAIQSSNNKSITVKVISTATRGNQTITASVDNLTISQALWTGLPGAAFTLTSYSGVPYDSNKLPDNANAKTSWTFKKTITDDSVSEIEFEVKIGTYSNFVYKNLSYPTTSVTAEELGIARGQSASILIRVKNNCGWSTGKRSGFAVYNPTLCESGVGINCNIARVSGRNADTTEKIKIFKIYPNPSNDTVFVEVPEENEVIKNETIIDAELFDLTGKSISKVVITNNKVRIDVSNLPKGVYLLKINSDGKIETHQFVIN
jgi:Secretion system C-terminal sorting domain/Pregnancy-associated plasma protein-A